MFNIVAIHSYKTKQFAWNEIKKTRINVPQPIKTVNRLSTIANLLAYVYSWMCVYVYVYIYIFFFSDNFHNALAIIFCWLISTR